jgi:type IV pilus assembly protein PilM
MVKKMEIKEILNKEYLLAVLKKYKQKGFDFYNEIFQKDFIVGFDIGKTSVKLAQFIKKEDGLHLVKLCIEELESALTLSSENREVQTLAALKKLLRGVDINNSKFIAAVTCPKTAVRKVTTPYMPRSELNQAIKLAAKNYFPFPIDDMVVEFEILDEIIEKGVKKYEVVVAVAPRKTINNQLALLKKVGIKPSSFVPCSYALQKGAGDSKEGETLGFVYIGGYHTDLIICRGNNLLFFRRIPLSGNDFTKAMTGTLISDKGKTELSLDEAERVKREIGIPSEEESRMIEDKISTVQILSMLHQPLEQLGSEIERCLDYYREESGGGKVDSLLLLGGSASFKGLSSFLSRHLGIAVKIGNPLDNLSLQEGGNVSPNQDLPRLAAAIGAALTQAKGLNLLPSEIKEETKQIFKRTTIQSAVVIGIFMLAFIYIGMKIQLGNFQKRITAANKEFLSFQPELKGVAEQNIINTVLMNEPYWENVFKELSNIIHDDIYLTNFIVDNKTIKMRGIVVSRSAEVVLSDFILALEKGIFKNVRLVSTKDLDDNTGNEFELKCWVDSSSLFVVRENTFCFLKQTTNYNHR